MNKYAHYLLSNYPILKEAANEENKKKNIWNKLKKKNPAVNGEEFNNSVDSVLNEKSAASMIDYLDQELTLKVAAEKAKALGLGKPEKMKFGKKKDQLARGMNFQQM